MEVDRSFCQEVLQLFSPGTKLVSWKTEGFDQVVGFHGHHCLLKICYDTGEGKEINVSFFVKSATRSKEVFEKYYRKIRCFEKEHYMLTKVMIDLESKVNVKLTSRCILSRIDDLVVLEDLNNLGYKPIASQNELDWEHVKVALKKLATFHAASILSQAETKSNLASTYPEIAFETFFNEFETEEGCVFFSTYKVFLHFLEKKMDDIPKEKKTPFKEWLKNTILKLARPSRTFKNVICHGDPWKMNFMFKYDDNNKVQEAILIDFQVSRIAPAALDIHLFMGLTFGYKKTTECMGAVTDIYYSSLSETLKSAGGNAADLLSRKEMDESMAYYAKFGPCVRTMYFMTIKLPPESLLEASGSSAAFLRLMTQGDVELCSKAFDTDKAYRESCQEAIRGAYQAFLES